MSNPYPRSAEHKAKIAAWGKGRSHAPLHNARISASRQATPGTAEWKRLVALYLDRREAASILTP